MSGPIRIMSGAFAIDFDDAGNVVLEPLGADNPLGYLGAIHGAADAAHQHHPAPAPEAWSFADLLRMWIPWGSSSTDEGWSR